jgi:chemotaxis protein MotB
MRRRGKDRRGHNGGAGHERWLVSYADFITLLFAFFVVLFATGQSDKSKKVQLEASITSAFQEMGMFEAHTKLPPLPIADGNGQAPQLNSMLKTIAQQRDPMKEVKQRIAEAAAPEIAKGTIGIHETPNGLVVSLEEAGFFDSGATDIRPSALPVLARIAAVLPESPLRVEGHTDNVPIHTTHFASNWELSSARASSIGRLLLKYPNIRPENLSVAGYAEFHSAASNDTAEGRARNRRVDLVLLKPDM